MSMHMMRERVTHKSKKSPNRKPGHTAAQAKHNEWLREMGVHPDQLKNKPKQRSPIPSYKSDRQTVPTSDKIVPVQTKRKQNVYTGDELAGIGTMHKSNMVPVRKDSTLAKEIAEMRRN